jgi:hypothetical protein
MNSWEAFIAGNVTGGMGLKLIDYLIAWARERREQKSSKTAHEKDRPRFRVDTSKVPTAHAGVPAVRMKILSLGSLPITINEGEVFIEAEHYPERVQSHQLKRREISPACPIEIEFPLPPKITDPSGIREPQIKLVCEFSYDGVEEPYKEERKYNHRSGRFE